MNIITYSTIVVYVVVTVLFNVCVAYLLAAACSSHVFVDVRLTDWGNGWTWFWILFWLSGTSSTTVVNK